MVSGSRALLEQFVIKFEGGCRVAAERIDDLCFHTYEEFSPSPPRSLRRGDGQIWEKNWQKLTEFGRLAELGRYGRI